MANSVFGIVPSLDQATDLVNNLKSAGFSADDISVLFPDKQGTREFAHEQHTKAPEGATVGVTTGGALGGLLGLLAGLGALAIPGVGPFIAAGPVLAALSGGAVGGVIGGVTGALVGLGIPEVEARLYEGKLKEGNILVAAHADDRAKLKQAEDLFRASGALHVKAGSTKKVPASESVDRDDERVTGH
jgi:hypothetical protein